MSDLRTYVEDFERTIHSVYANKPFSMGYHCYDSNMHVFIETLAELNYCPPFVVDMRLLAYEKELNEDLSTEQILEKKLTDISQQVLQKRAELGRDYQPCIIFEQLEYSDGTIDEILGMVSRYGMNPEWFVTGERNSTSGNLGFAIFKQKDADEMSPGGGDGFYMPVFMTTSMSFSHHIHDTFSRTIYYFNDYVLSASPRLTDLEELRDKKYNQAYKELRENHERTLSAKNNLVNNTNNETEQKNNNKPLF
jgi:hypothetical protein